MRSALIKDGEVVNIAEGMPQELVDEELVDLAGYVKCPDDVGIGWSYDGTNFTAPPPVPVEDTRDYKAKRRAEFPPVDEQLDAIWKELDRRKTGGDTLDKEANAILEKIKKVKKRHPKKPQLKKGRSKND